MKEHTYLSGALPQIYEREIGFLRGYDPLKEIYRWNVVSSWLVGEMIVVCAALIPFYNNLFFMQSNFGWLHVDILVLLFLIVLGFCFFFLPLVRYRREKRKRDMLRREALTPAEHQPLLFPGQPLSSSQELSLPLHIESRQKKIFTPWIWIGLLLFFVVLGLNYLSVFGISSAILFWFSMLSVCGGLLLPNAGPGVNRALKLRIAGHYLLPSLQVDDEGITARYGRDTITMRWRDARYFALVSSTTFRTIAGYKQTTSIPRREAYELCDGENMICWLVAAPFSSHCLLQNGEVVLSDQQYAAFTQQLAALIVERTGLPLYDFRAPARKCREK